MDDKTYWLGELVGSKRVGGIKVDGKLYAIGEPFPADKVDAKKLAGFKKAGSIGSAPFPVADSVAEDAKGKEITTLRGRVAELMGKAKTDGDTIAGFQLGIEEAGGVTKEKELRIIELESEVTRLTGELKEAGEKKASHIKAHTKKTKKKDGKK